jgi:hypothetical protein
LNFPARFEQIGFDVVLRPKVEAVGAKSEGYWLLCLLGFGATNYSFGMRL